MISPSLTFVGALLASNLLVSAAPIRGRRCSATISSVDDVDECVFFLLRSLSRDLTNARPP